MVAPQNQTISSSAITKPSVIAYPNGGTSIKSAAQNTSAANTQQSSALSKVGGRRRRSKRRKSRKKNMRGGAIPISTPTTGYKPVSDQNVTSSSTKLAALQAGSAEQSKNDALVGKTVGGRGKRISRKRRGGVKWECYSGGGSKRRKTMKTHKKM